MICQFSVGLIQRDRAEGLLCWRRSGFSIDGSVGLYATDPAAMEPLAQYMARPPISLSKVTLEEQGANVLFHTKYNPYFRQSFKLFAITDFIAALTQHLPPESIEYGRASSPWARLVAKIYGADPFICPRCGNSMRVLPIITVPSQVDRILRHLIKIDRAPPGLILAALH